MVTYPAAGASPCRALTMPVSSVIDVHDPRVRDYRLLGDPRELRTRGLFVAEGRLVVERLLRDTRYRVDSLLLNPASFAALGPALAKRPDVTIFECPTGDFEAITGFNIHRGCLALVHRLPLLSMQDAVGASRLVVVLEGVTDADNVGGVFRNAAAFGASAVLLSPTCCDPLYRKAVRTSVGHVLRVPFARVDPWPVALQELRASGFTIAALSPRQPAMTLDEFASSRAGDQRTALLVGTEGNGLSANAEAQADVRVRIPMQHTVDSINLSVATGVALSRLGSESLR